MPENVIPKTWGEAKKLGWRFLAVTSAYGYISRKTNVEEQPLKQSLKGAYKGKWYYDSPSFKSTKYHDRVYIEPPENSR